jgi:hypothetical protein
MITLAALLTACGGGSSDSGESGGSGASSQTPASGAEEQSFSGIVIDGYIGNAVVCLDLNNNLQCDPDEPSARTSSDEADFGSYSFTTTETVPSGTQVLAEVGIDATDETRGPVSKPFNLLAPSEQPGVVTPLTTLVSQEIIDSGKTLSPTEAEEAVKTNLGFSEDTELLENDFVAADDSSLIATAEVIADALAIAKETLTENDVSSDSLDAAEIAKSAVQVVKNNIGSIVAGGEAIVTSEEVAESVTQVVEGQVQAIVVQTLSGDGSVVDLADVIASGQLLIVTSGEYLALDDNGNGVWDKESEEEKYYDSLYVELIYFPEVGEDGAIALNDEDELKAAMLIGDDIETAEWIQGWWSEGTDYVLFEDELVQLRDQVSGTLDGNCLSFYDGSFCFVRKDLGGKAMSDVLPGICQDDDGTVRAGCNADAALPDGAYGYDLQRSVPDNPAYGGIYTIFGGQTWGGYVRDAEPTIDQFIAQYAQPNFGSRGENCNTAFRVGSYDAGTKTGTFEWVSNTDCSEPSDFAMPENIETTAFEVLTFGETEILKVKSPLVYLANSNNDQEPYLTFAAVPGEDGEVGVYGGFFAPSGTKISLPFTGSPERTMFASRALVDFVLDQIGIPAFPYELFIDE